MSVLIEAAESKGRTQRCPARETGLPEMCITGLRGAQQAHPPEQSGVHCLKSIPAGKKNADLVWKWCDEKKISRPFLTVMFIHATVKY